LPKPAKASVGVSQPASTASSTATSASSSKGSGFKKFQARVGEQRDQHIGLNLGRLFVLCV
jgi:hypothetical protein